MSEAPKKRGRPKKAASITEPPPEILSKAEKPAKRVRKVSTKATTPEVVKDERKPVKRKREKAIEIAVAQNDPEGSQESPKWTIQTVEEQTRLVVIENSRILQEVVALSTPRLSTPPIPSVRPAAVPAPPVPSMPSDLQDLPSSPPHFTSSPILNQAAALSTGSRAKSVANDGPQSVESLTSSQKGEKPADATQPTRASIQKTSSKERAPAQSKAPSLSPKDKAGVTETKPMSDIAPRSTGEVRVETKSSPRMTWATSSKKPAASVGMSGTDSSTSGPLSAVKEANKFAVSQLSARPGAGAGAQSTRETAAALGPTNPRYKATARRLLAIMVSLPIAIVLSYQLYERLVLGQEPKVLRAATEKLEDVPMSAHLATLWKKKTEKRPEEDDG